MYIYIYIYTHEHTSAEYQVYAEYTERPRTRGLLPPLDHRTLAVKGGSTAGEERIKKKKEKPDKK